MASLPSLQSATCRSTPGRPGSYLQSSCSHRVTPFTSRTRKWAKRANIKQCVPWTSCNKRSSSRTYAAAVEDPPPEDAVAEEAELIADDEDERDAMLDDEEFKPHSVYEISEEQLQDRNVLISTLSKSMETTDQPLTAQEEEEEQDSRDLAARIAEGAIEIEQKFGSLMNVSGGSRESPLPFTDDKFWQEVEDDAETLEFVDNFHESKVAKVDPLLQYLVSTIPPKPLSEDEAFHSDPAIVELRDAQVEDDVTEYTDEEKAVLAMLEGEELEEEEDESSPVLTALTDLLGVPEPLTEEEQEMAKEAASAPAADINELLQDKEFANVVDIAALTSGLVEIPEEQTRNVKWVANTFTKAAAETTYGDVVSSALESVQSAAGSGDVKQSDVEAFKALADSVSSILGDSAAAPVELGEGFGTALRTALASIAKEGFVEPVGNVDNLAVEAFLAEHKDQLQEFEALDAAFNELMLPDEHTAREQSQQMLLNLVAEADEPDLTAAAMVSDISLADAASAKDVFLKEAKAVLSEQDYQQVQAYVQSAFLAKVRESGEVGDAEPEVPELTFPEVEGIDVGDDEVDQVKPDLSKIVADLDDADDTVLDDFDEDVVKWRHVKAELLRTLAHDETDEGEEGAEAIPDLDEQDGASAASMKMLMQLVEDASEGRPLLKDFKLDDAEVAGEEEYPSLETVLAKMRESGDAEASADTPVLSQLLPLLQEAAVEKAVPTPALAIPLPEEPENEDEALELQDLYDPLGDFTTPVVNDVAAVQELQQLAREKAEFDKELGLEDDVVADDEFEADEKEKALLAQMPSEDTVQQWAEGEGFLMLGLPDDELQAALERAEAAAKAFEESTSGLDDPTGLSDEDCKNLKVAFDNLYYIKAATSPQAAQLKLAAEKIREGLLANRFADAVGDLVESTVTRGHVDDLNLLQVDEGALADMEDEQADQAISALVDQVAAVAEDKLVAAAEEAVKDMDDIALPEVDGEVPDNVDEQFQAMVMENVGAQRLGEMKAEAEIQAMLDNPRLLGLDIDPVQLAKADDADPEDFLMDLKMLEAAGVVPPVDDSELQAEVEVAEEGDEPKLVDPAKVVQAAVAVPAEGEAEEEDDDVLSDDDDDEAVEEDPEAPINPPSAEGAILGELVDQVMDSLKKLDEDEHYLDDDMYDAEADTEVTAEVDEVDEDEEAFDDEDDEADEVEALALNEADEVEEEADEEEELSDLVYTSSAARDAAADAEDDLEEYGEEEGEGDVAPEDMRNEYNSFMSEELFGNPTFADIWEEMGIPEMRPKEPVRMDQEDYDSTKANAQVDEADEDEDTPVRPAAFDDEEGEEDLKDVPIGNWFGDEDDDGEVAAAEVQDADETTSLEKLSKYYGGSPQSWEGLDSADAPRADLDVFSGATYLDGGDNDDRAADDASGLMERVTMTKDGVVFIERVIQVQRVTKVVKGGNIMSFRCTAVVGNRSGIVGVGIGSAREVAKAVQKAVSDAKKNVIMVPLTKYASIPHRVEKKFKASQCVINPAADGTGCIAGGAIRSVLELAGVKNCLAKQLGSRNPMNNAKLTIEALKSLQTWGEVAAKRNVPIEYLFAQNQEEADRALAEHRGEVEEELL